MCACICMQCYKTMEVLRGWDLGAVWMSELMYACSLWCVLGRGRGVDITVGDRQMGMEMSRLWAHANLLLQLPQLIQAQSVHAMWHPHAQLQFDQPHAQSHSRWGRGCLCCANVPVYFKVSPLSFSLKHSPFHPAYIPFITSGSWWMLGSSLCVSVTESQADFVRQSSAPWD